METMSRFADSPATPSERMSAYRDRMRAAGLKPVQIWVPDPNAPGFAAKCRKQARAIAKGDKAGKEALDFIESAYEWPEE
jgi:hypothetical protein